MNWSNFIRQFHRWTSIVFTLAVAANCSVSWNARFASTSLLHAVQVVVASNSTASYSVVDFVFRASPSVPHHVRL